MLAARLIRSVDADIVHTHLVHADLYGALAAKLRGRRLVSTKHNDDPFRAGPFRYVERALAHAADRVVAITDSLRRFTIERVGVPAGKVETIHYGLDGLPEAWGSNPTDEVPTDARVLLAVSRLTRQKGLDTAIEALRSLPDDVVLVVLGEGPERAALAARSPQGRVFLPGRVPDVAAWLRRAAVFVHPARWEGFGLGVLEAMIAGLPVVATNVSSLPELVGDAGILVPPDDADALAGGIASALERPDLGAAARERAAQEFSVARMADRTASLYESIRSSKS
jgi:glycosyltransferase involved in cell wall biosynthesis